jgi:hypothetical protein
MCERIKNEKKKEGKNKRGARKARMDGAGVT